MIIIIVIFFIITDTVWNFGYEPCWCWKYFQFEYWLLCLQLCGIWFCYSRHIVMALHSLL